MSNPNPSSIISLDSNETTPSKLLTLHTKKSYVSFVNGLDDQTRELLLDQKKSKFVENQISTVKTNELHLCAKSLSSSFSLLRPGSTYSVDLSALTKQEDSVNYINLLLKFVLSSYKFTQYKSADDDDDDSASPPAKLILPRTIFSQTSIDTIANAAESTFLVRSLINGNAGEYKSFGDTQISPSTIQRCVENLSEKATTTTITGDDLLTEGNSEDWGEPNKYGAGMIHAVGQGVTNEKFSPRLIDLKYNMEKKNLPLVTLVGKGVTFDTGGLSMKTAGGMLTMKKDMGGAAHVIGLANMIMNEKHNPLPIRLRVLVPAVENVVGPNSFRPGDVIRAVNGITVEIGNTDAEGRLILGDALAISSCGLASDNFTPPDLIIDFATLTGAARVAMGPEIPAFFTNSDECADLLSKAGGEVDDPMWRLPLVESYKTALKSKIADVRNVPEGFVGGGAITAALFLEKFVGKGIDWIHVDVNGASRDKMGEAQGMRAMYEMLRLRFR